MVETGGSRTPRPESSLKDLLQAYPALVSRPGRPRRQGMVQASRFASYALTASTSVRVAPRCVGARSYPSGESRADGLPI